MLRKHFARRMPSGPNGLVVAACAWLASLPGCDSTAPTSPAQTSASGQSSAMNDANTAKSPWMPRQIREKAPEDASVDSSSTTRRDMNDAGIAVRSGTPAAAGMAAGVDAGARSESAGMGAAGMMGVDAATPMQQAMPATAGAMSTPSRCSRDVLLQRLQAYFDAMFRGDPQSLPLHPNVYYTENGQKQRLGGGVWSSRLKAQFTRYALDSQQCSSVTEAVLSDSLGAKTIFSVRLRYLDDLLIDVEAMVVQQARELFAPDAIVVPPPDPWLAAISDDKRMSRDALVAFAERFFDSIVRPDIAPPHAMTCLLRQNGVEVGGGNCSPGTAAERFEQLRYPVVDETTGLVGAVGLGHNFLVMFLIKIEDGTLINIDSVGGHASNTSGW